MKIIVYGRDNSLHGLLSIEYILFFITMDFFILMRSPLIILIITKIMLSSTDITRLLRLAHVIKYGKAIYRIFLQVWRLFHCSVKEQPRTLVIMRMYPVGNRDKQAILP